jgi:hypothetical protein
MFDLILAATAAARGVAPIMFGDELFVRSLCGPLGFAGRGHGERFPMPAAPPLILGKEPALLVFKHVPHRQRQVGLAVKGPRNERDRAPRHQLPHKDHSAPPFVPAFPANVEAEIHFFEIVMEGNRQTNDAGIKKKKTDDADERLATVKIELGLNRDQGLQNFRVDGEVEHGQVTPVRGEKWFQWWIERSAAR